MSNLLEEPVPLARCGLFRCLNHGERKLGWVQETEHKRKSGLIFCLHFRAVDVRFIGVVVVVLVPVISRTFGGLVRLQRARHRFAKLTGLLSAGVTELSRFTLSCQLKD